MSERTSGWCRVAGASALLLVCAACGRPRETRQESSTPAPAATAKASASAAPAQASAAPARPLANAQLEALLALSKSSLSPTEKRKQLQLTLEHFPVDQVKQREDLIVAAVVERAFDPPKWTTITSYYQGRRAEIDVTEDALTMLGVRFDVTAEGAQRIADQLGAILPTPRILQLIWEQADVRLKPCTLPADSAMASTARMIEHSKCVDSGIAGRKGLIANVGKYWVLTNRLAEKRNVAANYGWFVKGQRPIQTVGMRHDTSHTDYSQVLRLIKPTIRVDGREVDIRQVGRSPELWGLVSDEGPLFVWRATRPGVAPSPDDSPVAAAPPPKPGDPKGVHLALKAGGFPISVEQLPQTTTGLRRNTFQRRLLNSVRLRTEDVPEEAYWSAAASTCGGRDIFFELFHQMGIDREELVKARASLHQGLACGRAVSPQIRAGIGVYQITYDYESAPSGLSLLTLTDDFIRQILLYPALSPTPPGVHRAYCSDDEGGPRSVCQEGERSRLLLAVNHGYLSAYARELPSLLARLTEAQAPAPKLAQLAEFFLEPTRAEEVTVAEGGSCAFAMDTTAWALSPDETSRQRVLDAVNDNAVLCATRSWGTFLNPSRELAFVAKDETAALVLAAALRRRAVEAAAQVMPTTSRRDVQVAFDNAYLAAAARTWRSAKVEVKGVRLSMTLTIEPSEAEQRAMSRLLDERQKTAQQAAAVVRSLADGKLPSAAELEPFAAPPARGLAANQ